MCNMGWIKLVSHMNISSFMNVVFSSNASALLIKLIGTAIIDFVVLYACKYVAKLHIVVQE